MKTGAVLVDVSLPSEFDDYHPAGAVNVPWRLKGSGSMSAAATAVREGALASLGVTATYQNPNFISDLAAATQGATQVIFACAGGGTLTASVNFPDGQASKSLLACVAVLQASGAARAGGVAHLKGGLASWFEADLPGAGEEEQWDKRLGRMPTVGGPQWEQDNKELMRKD